MLDDLPYLLDLCRSLMSDKPLALILTAYYTSETGGSRELQYELVPGKWEPDLPFVPGSRAWSSDWTAVEFS